MDSSIIPPSGGRSIPFSSGEKESNTFMFASLVEGLLARNRHVGTASIPRTQLFDNGRILTPATMEDIRRGYDVRRSVLVNMRKSDELYTTVDGPTPNETEAASWRKVKDTPKGIFHHCWRQYPTIIENPCSRYTWCAYVPVTLQKAFDQRCEHERIRLLFSARKRDAS